MRMASRRASLWRSSSAASAGRGLCQMNRDVSIWDRAIPKHRNSRKPAHSMPETCLYQGEVVHRRLSPVRHALRYRVFNLFADVDELQDIGKSLRLFSYN